LAHRRPHPPLIVAAVRRNLHVEAPELALEIALELARRIAQHRRGLVAGTLVGRRPAHARQRFSFRFERQPADRALDVADRHAANVAPARPICHTGRTMNGGEKRSQANTLGRRTMLAGAGALWSVGSAGSARAQRAADAGTPIVFVHGNGDSGALWINNLWRFEANGFKRSQLFAIDFAYPNARSDDPVPQPLHSSAVDEIKELSAYVAQVRATTRRRQVALIAQSRGGNIVRGFLKAGGAPSVSHAILCGAFPRGVFVSADHSPGS